MDSGQQDEVELLNNTKKKEIVNSVNNFQNNERTVFGNFEIEKSSDDQPKSSTTFLFTSACTACLTIFASGIGLSWTSPVNQKLKNIDETPLPELLTHTQESWLTSTLSLGAAIGSFLGGYLADKYGRKNAILIAAILLFLSFLTLAFSSYIELFYLARFLIGLCVGAAYTVMPMYLGEIAEVHNKGTISSLTGVFGPLGLLFPYLVGPYVSVRIFSMLCTTPLVIFFCIVTFIPESPVYHATKGKHAYAEKALAKLRMRKNNEKELSEIIRRSREERSKRGGIRELFKTQSSRQAFLIAGGSMVLQQLCGIYALLSNLQHIFEKSGTDIPSDICSIAAGVVQVIATVFTSVVVEKLGRRILLIISSIGCCFSTFILSVYFYYQETNVDLQNLKFIPVTCIVLYIILFNIGLNSLPSVLLSEMFPNSVKAIAASCVQCMAFLGAFLVTWSFPILSKHLGMSVPFFIYGVLSFLGSIFIILKVPETKGKNLEEIREMLESKKI